MSKGLSRRRLIALMAAAAMIAAAIWTISASARVSPVGDGFKATGTVVVEGVIKCQFQATGTMPASGSVVSTSAVTFSSCRPVGGGTAKVTTKGTWTFTMAFGLPATAKLSIPKEGLSLETSETAIGSCTATSESAYTGPGDTWENGVDLPAGSGFTNSESELKDSIPAHYTGTVTCQSLRAITLEANEHEVGTPLVWHDTTHETSTILNGS